MNLNIIPLLINKIKKRDIFIIIFLFIINSVYSISLFPSKQASNILYPSLKIEQVFYSDNTIKILISSNSNQEFHGFRINIYYTDNQDTLLINSQLQPYSTIS